MILVGVRVQVRPVAGNIVLVRSTVPVKPLVGVIVIVEMPVSGGIVTLAGLAEIVKSEEVAILMVWLVVDWFGADTVSPPKKRT